MRMPFLSWRLLRIEGLVAYMRSAAAFLLLFGCLSVARADVTGVISGTVTDQSGGAVARASVILRNSNIGVDRQAPTDTDGHYEFLSVPIGSGFEIDIEKKGFATSRQSGITLTVNQQLEVDFHLQIGSVLQKVEVSGQVVQVETTSTQLGNVITSHEVVALPLNGRSYTDLLSLQPGVVPITSSSAAVERLPSGNLDPGTFSVNGGRENGNSFLINGGDVNESRDNGASIVPTLDAIAEFRMLTNNYDAEYGKFAGGIVNVVTKEGANSFHGDLFEFLRNDLLDARNYFEPTRGNFKQNQFGGNIGGHILKDRLFFFTDYQGTRQVFGINNGTVTVPSLSERDGDFSDVSSRGLPSLSGLVTGSNAAGAFAQTLSSRLGYPVTAGEPYWTSGCNTLAQAQAGMCVFPGQVIPQSAWSPAATGLLKFIPEATGYENGIPTWSSAAENQITRDDKWGERIDWVRNQSDTWSYYYSFDDSSVLNPYAGGNVPGFAGLTPSRGQQANVRDAHTLGSSAVNTLTLNYTRYAIHAGLPTSSELGNPANFGFVSGGLGLVPSASQYSGVPSVELTGAYSASFGVPTFISRQVDNTFQISDTYQKVISSHTLTFGTDLRYYQVNTRQNIIPNGLFQFSGAETGNDFADFLIGAPSQFNEASPQLQNVRSKYLSGFGQDSFKVSPSLTVNYGLRWEASEPYYDEEGMLMTFVPGKQSVLFPNAPTGWVFPGDPGIPSTVSPTRWNNLAPRFGLAYSPSAANGLLGKMFGGPGKTSIRMGGGIFYTSFEELIANYEVGDAPFGNFYESGVPVYLEEPFKSRVNADNPGQRFPSPIHTATPAQPNPVSFLQYVPISTSQVWQTNNVLPYVEQFNFTVQRQLPSSTVLTVGYVGSLGRHLIGQEDFNPGNPQKCLHIAALFAAAAQPGGCGPFGEDSIYSIDGQTFYGTRPYSVTSGRYLPEGQLDFSTEPAMGTFATSNYNALQVSLEKRAGRATFLAAYTYSKSLDDTSGFVGPYVNPYNPKLSVALSSFNMTQDFVVSYNYEFPSARSLPDVARALVGGWEISGITRFSTGLPVPITQSGDLSLCGCPGSDVDKPNYLGGPIQFYNPRNSPTHQYFSTDEFTSETLGVAGNANRSFFSGPGLNNWDIALHRIISIREGLRLELRGEFFNAFNHAQFMTPTGNYNSATFGDITAARDPRIGQVALKVLF